MNHLMKMALGESSGVEIQAREGVEGVGIFAKGGIKLERGRPSMPTRQVFLT